MSQRSNENMPSISINIYKRLTCGDKAKLRASSKQLGEVKIYEYKELSFEALEFAKCVFSDFNIINFLRDNLLWEGFVVLAVASYRVAVKRQKNREVHFWITDLSGPFPVNIAFTSKAGKEVATILHNLRQVLPKLFGEYNPQKGEIVWISYDLKTESWKVKVF